MNLKNTIPSYNNFMFDNMNKDTKQELFQENNNEMLVDEIKKI